MVVAVLAGLLAAASLGAAAVLQHRAAAEAPTEHALSPRLLVDLLHRPVWLAGLVVSALGFILQGVALGFGSLTLVQPLIVLDLAFALPLAARLQRRRLGRREWLATLAICAGLVAFLTPADPTNRGAGPAMSLWLLVGIAVSGFVVVCLAAARRATPTVRATLLAACAGACFGVLAALLKSTTHLLAHGGLFAALSSWQPYALTVVVVVGETLGQSAYQAGPLAAALPVMDTLEPSVAVVIAVTAFGETVNYSVGALALETAGIVAMVAGIVALDRSPVILAMQEQQQRGETRPSSPRR